MAVQWKYTISPKGWLDMPRDKKREISSAIVSAGYTHTHHSTKKPALQDAERIKKLTGIDMDVVQIASAMMPF
jgi:hypothetical protein